MSTTPPRGHSQRTAPDYGPNKPRVDFDRERFEKTIASHGYRVLWEQAARCACRSYDTNQPNPECQVCGGSGWEYHSGHETTAIIDRLSSRPEGWIAYGEYVSGMAQITVRALHRPGRWHRFTLLDSVMEHSEVLRRDGSVQRLSYPVAPVSEMEVVNGALCNVQRGVLRLRAMDSITNQPGPVLHEGQDFRLTEDGRIDWTPGDGIGSAPAEGAPFAVTYYLRPRYVVTEQTHAVRDTRASLKSATPEHERLPVTVMAKLDWMAREGDS